MKINFRTKYLPKLIFVLYIFFLLGGLEIISRLKQNYLIFPLKLKKSAFFEMDKLKVWNDQFVLSRKNYFKNWPIPLETFSADSISPRYLYKPNLTVTSKNGKLEAAKTGDKIYWSSNSWGFRGKEFSVRKQENVIRIVTLGASTTEGSQGNQETYPFYLEKQLKDKGYKIEVINAGHHGFSVNDLVALFKERIIPLKPNIVIFYEASNNTSPDQWLVESWYGWYSWAAGYGKGFRLLHQYSATFAWIVQALGFEKRLPPPLPHTLNLDEPKSSQQNYKDELRKLVKMSKSHNIQLVLSTFITIANKDLNINQMDHTGIWKNIYLKWYPFTPEEVELIYNHFNIAIKDIAVQEKIPLIDLATMYPKEPHYFIDHIHFTPMGNWLLASHLAESLENQGLLELATQ